MLFRLYKERGSRWSALSAHFPGRNENQVKNRFYSTLRRLAKKSHGPLQAKVKIGKEYLVRFVDDAILYGHNCRSKRGRKPKNVRQTYDSNQGERNVQDKACECAEEEIKDDAKFFSDELKEEFKPDSFNIQDNINIRQSDNADMKDYMNEENKEVYNEMGGEGLEGSGHLTSLLLVDPNYVQLLVRQNAEVLDLLDENIRQQTDDPQQLHQLLKDLQDKLKETQKTIRAIYWR